MPLFLKQLWFEWILTHRDYIKTPVGWKRKSAGYYFSSVDLRIVSDQPTNLTNS
jgi:hypothetical protein